MKKSLLLAALLLLSSCEPLFNEKIHLKCGFESMSYPGLYRLNMEQRKSEYFSFPEERWEDSDDDVLFALNSIIISRKQLVGYRMQDTQFIVSRKTMKGKFIDSNRDFDCELIDNGHMQDQVSLYLDRLSQDRLF